MITLQIFKENEIIVKENDIDDHLYLIESGKVKITTSIDAGTKETFKKIRGVKGMQKVLSNLEKYFVEAQKGVVVKYILTDDNFSDLEIDSFLDNIKKSFL